MKWENSSCSGATWRLIHDAIFCCCVTGDDGQTQARATKIISGTKRFRRTTTRRDSSCYIMVGDDQFESGDQSRSLSLRRASSASASSASSSSDSRSEKNLLSSSSSSYLSNTSSQNIRRPNGTVTKKRKVGNEGSHSDNREQPIIAQTTASSGSSSSSSSSPSSTSDSSSSEDEIFDPQGQTESQLSQNAGPEQEETQGECRSSNDDTRKQRSVYNRRNLRDKGNMENRAGSVRSDCSDNDSYDEQFDPTEQQWRSQKRVRLDGCEQRKQIESSSESDVESLQTDGMRGRYTLLETVDWDQLASTTWGKEKLYKRIHELEISALISLATSYGDMEPCESQVFEQSCKPSSKPNFQNPKAINPLIGLPSSPMPPSYLNFITQRAVHVPNFDARLIKTFDDSAAVAIGMLLEESITASLLPLAELHVIRCRQLENEREDNSFQTNLHTVTGTSCTVNGHAGRPCNAECPFDQWTLPPEEAIQRSVSELRTESTMGSPTAVPPARWLDKDSKSSASSNSPMIDAVQTWCRTHGLSLSLVNNNMDIFKIFLAGGSAPATTEPKITLVN